MQKFILIFYCYFWWFLCYFHRNSYVISCDFHLFLFCFHFFIFILCILHLLCELLSLSQCVRSIWQRFSCFDAFDETAAIKIYCETLNKDNVGAAFAVAVAVAVTVSVAAGVTIRRQLPMLSSRREFCLPFEVLCSASFLAAVCCALCCLHLFVVVLVVAVWLWNRQQ